ncbi:MAG: molybdopterin-dependent oxidoreductase, partial [Actinomycetota bacterium]|nr:molybdopterin-dependent oxidoreductase [Actinomycetota bacterium]
AQGPEAVESLLELTAALGLEGKAESGLLEIPDITNARGLREVGCLPDAGPGLSEVPAGRDVEEIRAGLESGEVKSLVLFGVDPLRDFPDTEGWRRALEAAESVICFSMTATDSSEYADVIFPTESHAEKDGTVTHTEGRIQRVRPSAKRPGEIRPGWMVLAELSAAIGHETNIHSGPQALQAITEAVPFYAGLNDSEIGGRGIRWQDRSQAGSFVGAGAADVTVSAGTTATSATPTAPAAETVSSTEAGGADIAPAGVVPPEDVMSAPPAPNANGDGTLTLGTYRDIWANPATDLSPALNYLIPAQRLEIATADAKRLGLSRGDVVGVKSGDHEVVARVAVRGAMPEGTCFLMEGTLEGNANVFANGQPAQVEIGKPSVALDLVQAGGES